jgi:hypothetical protein
MRSVAPWLVVVAAGLAACKSQGSPSKAKAEPLPSAAAEPDRPAQKFGAAIQAQKEAELTRVLSSPAEFQGQTVVVEGEVRRACSRKGCWMELAASKDTAAPACRVTFKDYGFFVPLDSAGSSARVEAAVEVADLKPAYVAHMEQEGARFVNKNPDGSAREVRLVANGVELWR